MLAYLPAPGGAFVWDDDTWTTKMGLHDGAGLRTIWSQPTALQQYYPLTATSFWLDYQFWKFWPLPYHAENVLLHALAALLFWRVLCRLQIPGAWRAGAVFGLHPVMVASAGWITERKNVLSLALCLASLLVYLRHVQAKPGEPGRGDGGAPGARHAWGVGPYVVAWFLFVGALLANPRSLRPLGGGRSGCFPYHLKTLAQERGSDLPAPPNLFPSSRRRGGKSLRTG